MSQIQRRAHWGCRAVGFSGSSGGSNQPRVAITATPNMTSNSRIAPAKQAPRLLNTPPRRSSPISRRAASAELMRIGSRPATFCCCETGPASIWLCKRLAGWWVTRWSASARRRRRRAIGRRSPAEGGGNRHSRSRRRRRGDSIDPGRVQRVPLRVTSESLEQHKVALGRRQLDEALGQNCSNPGRDTPWPSSSPAPGRDP